MANKRQRDRWTVVNRFDGSSLTSPTRETAIAVLKMIVREHHDCASFDFDEEGKTITVLPLKK